VPGPIGASFRANRLLPLEQPSASRARGVISSALVRSIPGAKFSLFDNVWGYDEVSRPFG